MKKYTPCFISRLYSHILSLIFLVVHPLANAEITAHSVPKTKTNLLEIQSLVQQNFNKVKKACVGIKGGTGQGSGVIVSEDGLILTAGHVVGGINRSMEILMSDGTKRNAISLGLHSEVDAAMMQMVGNEKYPFVSINKENDYIAGEWVIALGHPGGFNHSRGPVVRLGRIIRTESTTIQSDCTIVGGDSGGPLFNLDGELIAIHSRINDNLEVNKHVPMRSYLEHWDDLLRKKYIGLGRYGFKPPTNLKHLGISLFETKEGLKITKIDSSSPASGTKLMKGDILIELNTEKVPDLATLKAIMHLQTYQKEFLLTIVRNDQIKSILLKSNKQPRR